MLLYSEVDWQVAEVVVVGDFVDSVSPSYLVTLRNR